MSENIQHHCPHCGGVLDPARQSLCHFGDDCPCECDQVLAERQNTYSSEVRERVSMGLANSYREALEGLLAAIHTMPGIPNSELCKAMCSAREALNDPGIRA